MNKKSDGKLFLYIIYCIIAFYDSSMYFMLGTFKEGIIMEGMFSDEILKVIFYCTFCIYSGYVCFNVSKIENEWSNINGKNC